jgi:hypothetical protein
MFRGGCVFRITCHAESRCLEGGYADDDDEGAVVKKRGGGTEVGNGRQKRI